MERILDVARSTMSLKLLEKNFMNSFTCPICLKEINASHSNNSHDKKITCPHCREMIEGPTKANNKGRKLFLLFLPALGCSFLLIILCAVVAAVFLFPYPQDLLERTCGIHSADKIPNPLLMKFILLSVNAPRLSKENKKKLFGAAIGPRIKNEKDEVVEKTPNQNNVADLKNRRDILKMLFKHDKLNQDNPSQEELFYDLGRAARIGWLEYVKYLVEKKNVDVNQNYPDEKHNLLLVTLALSKNPETVEYLLQKDLLFKNLNLQKYNIPHECQYLSDELVKMGVSRELLEVQEETNEEAAPQPVEGEKPEKKFEDNIIANKMPSAGLVAYYPLNVNADDKSGYGNNGMVCGAKTCPDRFDRQHGAYSFDGQNDYILIPNAISLNMPRQITLSMWVNLKKGTSNQALISKGPNGCYRFGKKKKIYIRERYYGPRLKFSQIYNPDKSGNRWINYDNNYYFGSGPQYSIIYFSKRNISYYVKSTPIIGLGWIHVVGIIDTVGKKCLIYVNGEKVCERSINMPNMPTNTDNLIIGAVNSNKSKSLRYFVKGKLDDVAIYNRALSISEIKQIYNMASDTKIVE